MEQVFHAPEVPGQGRLLLLLEAFGERPVWGVRTLSRKLGLSPGATHRILSELTRMGFLSREAEGSYRLGWRAAWLARVLDKGLEPLSLLRSQLTQLAEATGETAHLSTLHEGQVVYLDKVEGWRGVKVSSRLGVPYPPHATASGKALLAEDPSQLRFLPQDLPVFTSKTLHSLEDLRTHLTHVARQGYAVDAEEMEEGAACVAVALKTPHGLFALSLSGLASRVLSQRERFAELLLGVKREMEGVWEKR